MECEDGLITVTPDNTTKREMKITMKCNRTGRVVSFEIPPDPREIVHLTLCEVLVYGYKISGLLGY